MGEFLEFLFFLAIGFVVGIFVYAQIILPLVYGFPKSVYLYFSGRLTLMGVVSQLVTPVIWILAVALLGVLVQAFAPSVNEFLISSSGFVIGQLLSILALLANFLSRRGRSDMADDFFQTTIKLFGKQELSVDQENICELHNQSLEEFSCLYSYDYISVARRLALRSLPEEIDAFPNVEKAVADGRFEDGGSIFFRFYTCSLCRQEYFSLILSNLSENGENEQQTLIESFDNMRPIGEFDDEQKNRWEYFLNEASNAARTGVLWNEEAQLLKLAALKGDYKVFKVIMEEIARRPAVEKFIEPMQKFTTGGSQRIVRGKPVLIDEQHNKKSESVMIGSNTINEAPRAHGAKVLAKRTVEQLGSRPSDKRDTPNKNDSPVTGGTGKQDVSSASNTSALNVDAGFSPEMVLIQEKIEKSNGRILKGTGRNIEDAFVVRAANSEEAVLSKYKKIAELEGVYGVDWVVEEQALIRSGDGVFDEITIRTRGEGSKTYYFGV